MLVKYQVAGRSVMLTDFADIDRVGSDVILTPFYDNVFPIIIKNVSETEYRCKILDELFTHNKVDLTQYSFQTYYIEEEDEVESNED